MRKNTLILITVVYFSLSLLFNYSLYPLLITNEYSDQYFLIFIYFLSEIFSFFFLIFFYKNVKKLVLIFGLVFVVE